MKTTITTCDVCGHKFHGKEGWEDAPAQVQLIFGHPRQQYDTRNLEDVCGDCTKALLKAFDAKVAELKPVK